VRTDVSDVTGEPDDDRASPLERCEEEEMLSQAVGLSFLALVIGGLVAAALPKHAPRRLGQLRA